MGWCRENQMWVDKNWDDLHTRLWEVGHACLSLPASRVWNRDDQDELVAQAEMQLPWNSNSFNPDQSCITTFFINILKRRRIDWLRKKFGITIEKTPEGDRDQSDAHSDADDEPGVGAEAKDEFNAVLARIPGCLNKVDPKYRMLARLCYDIDWEKQIDPRTYVPTRDEMQEFLNKMENRRTWAEVHKDYCNYLLKENPKLKKMPTLGSTRGHLNKIINALADCTRAKELWGKKNDLKASARRKSAKNNAVKRTNTLSRRKTK
jgi:DNA-directed RNA polymerase specialized sigma24 family protein